MYPRWTPLSDPCNVGSSSVPQYMYNFTSFRNAGNGIFHRLVGDVHWVSPNLLDNGGDAFFWRFFDFVGFKSESYVKNALMVGRMDGDAPLTVGASGGMFSPQHEFWMGGPITFVNYDNAGAVRACAEVSLPSSL